MADMLWTWGFLAFSAHLVVAYTVSKCGSPTVYQNTLLEEVHKGKWEFNNGDRVMYRCARGYTYSHGARVSSCQDGEWSPLEMQCKRKRCGSAGEILNGRFIQTGNAFEDIAYAVCNEGYVLQGELIRECLVNGWSGKVPTCVASDTPAKCPLLKNNKNATFYGTKVTYEPGETLPYSCNFGFQLIGSISVLQCEKTGKWNPSYANCQKINCETFSIANGKVKFSHLTFNVNVSISCDVGYLLRGPSVVTCGANSSWTPALPTCEDELVRVTCPPPAVPNSSGQDGYKIEYDVGEQATISCQEGFELIGSPQVITCGADGQWLGTPECRFTGGKCQPPPYFPRAHTEFSNLRHYEPNSAVRFICNHGYRKVRGPSTIYCRNGQWTELELICEKRKCGSAGEITNGRYHYTGSLFGDTATGSCYEGYRLVGVAVRHCREYGWDGRVPVCEAIQCPEPPMVPHADLFFDTDGIIKYGYVASYKCHFGTLIGDSDIICTEDGTWSAPAPRCEATCPVPSIRNALIVSGMRLRYQSGNSVTFRCRPGRRLSGPDVIKCGKDGHWKPRLPQCVFWY
ncbi:hypothetical protein AMELA_G00199640 [Ameiurus melas]|uniref:Sushi domain-containing protein n=1 Tax=Ameiurus melas TaxID=219545 RepID=A0A7J6AAH8_AMEME|nr:hypothetical protein AMELA_G00199640 [Ameiurus melas]